MTLTSMTHPFVPQTMVMPAYGVYERFDFTPFLILLNILHKNGCTEDVIRLGLSKIKPASIKSVLSLPGTLPKLSHAMTAEGFCDATYNSNVLPVILRALSSNEGSV